VRSVSALTFVQVFAQAFAVVVEAAAVAADVLDDVVAVVAVADAPDVAVVAVDDAADAVAVAAVDKHIVRHDECSFYYKKESKLTPKACNVASAVSFFIFSWCFIG
jgi:hypothetical protein